MEMKENNQLSNDKIEELKKFKNLLVLGSNESTGQAIVHCQGNLQYLGMMMSETFAKESKLDDIRQWLNALVKESEKKISSHRLIVVPK